MELYELTRRGEMLAHNINAPNNSRWRVLYYLSKRGQATKEQILQNVPDADGFDLYTLKRKGVITNAGQRMVV